MRDQRLSLYNLFPLYYTNISAWKQELHRIKDMGFTAIYINPIHYSGFSGSLYAPKDYFSVDPFFIDPEDPIPPMEQFCSFIEHVHHLDMKVISDLVINHSSIDHPFTIEHFDWYLKDKDGRIINPGTWKDGVWISWGDLAQFDHLNSPDRNNLWNYCADIIKHYIKIGIDGFRADVAYQIPSELWQFLISQAKEIKPELCFIAENLGCRLEDSKNLVKSGFDYLYNSVHWWNYQDTWFLEQYNQLSPIPSISFPESHNTERLMGKIDERIKARQHLILTGLISSSWMIITGTEFGWKNKPDVLKTKVADQESTDFDFTDLIKKINKLRHEYTVLNNEGHLSIKNLNNDKIVIIEKTWKDRKSKVFFIINLSDQNQCVDTNLLLYSTELISSYDLAHASEKELFAHECRVFYEYK